ncbi:DUF3237 domain-containing protein [Nesterenkonia sp. NBAIMH1]|uniref:DUF3237 domain-containing protein n=1 Tax=Nesterenkonia sp. NBAIMH1 TaxID=2600320 RepID=UPI001FEE152F|nr:DUF3237 domain-containing protein [Nesterenkonia sp. NBAIMH1]
MEYLTCLEINVDHPIEVGNTHAGRRRVVPILGGTAQGPALNGTVLPAGADFQVIRSPTVSDLDARYIIEADSGERIFVSNLAYRTGSAEDIAALAQGTPVPPERIYFRCSPRFEVAGEDLKWLESTVVVGAGVRTPTAVLINLWSVL